METTPNLQLPYIMSGQAQKHVTHNEAIRTLDALVQIGVESRQIAEPPVSVEEGTRYLVAASASGDWSGHEDKIAAWQDNSWLYYQPVTGWLVWVADEQALIVYDGSDWQQLALVS